MIQQAEYFCLFGEFVSRLNALEKFDYQPLTRQINIVSFIYFPESASADIGAYFILAANRSVYYSERIGGIISASAVP
jgi:hypothetical protein